MSVIEQFLKQATLEQLERLLEDVVKACPN